MSKLFLSILFATTVLAANAHAGTLPATPGDENAVVGGDAETDNLTDLVVTGKRARSSAVTGLDLTLRETPQSVSQIMRERIEQFGLTDVNKLLRQAPGVNVEQVETDRTYYNSRGFDVTNFQADGIGLPLIWGIQFGDLDTALFERVDIVRGANSMMTGTGNPSATINYIRKRPTATFQSNVSVQYGSWDTVRLEGDVSGPINASGTLRGRLIYANEDGGSYLDYKSVNRNVYAGLLAWDITPGLTATAGYSMNDNRSKGNLWGALPLQYSDGTLINYPVSASTSADWTYWNVKDETSFVELNRTFANGWQLKAVGTYKHFIENAKLLYAYNNPDPVTGLGVEGMSGIYPSDYKSTVFDVYASGPFDLFGRSHELVVGGQASQSKSEEYEDFSGDTVIYPAVQDWGQIQPAEPTYPGASLASKQKDDLYRIYAAAHLNVTDQLKFVVGANWLHLRSEGFSYGTPTPRNDKAVSPYAGVVFDATENISLYASYTDIFNPQSEVDINHITLDPAHGESYEAGVKSEWLDRRLYITGAVFRAKQAGLAQYAGSFLNGQSYYSGVDTTVTGYELEAVGSLTDQWSVSASWTQLDIEDATGADTRVFLPRKSFKLMTSYAFPTLRNLTLGAAVRWQSEVEGFDLTTVTQDAYGVLDLSARIDLTKKARLTVNVMNVTDEQYYASLMWNQAFYAPPRNVSVRLDYKF